MRCRTLWIVFMTSEMVGKMKLSLKHTLVGAVSGLACAGLPVQAEIIPGMPDALVCSVRDPTGALPWERLVFYASASTVDGRTLYKTLTSDPVVLLVSADGLISGGNLADCDGQQVETLKKEGRAFTLTSTTKLEPISSPTFPSTSSPTQRTEDSSPND
ncbi:MAG: hypothetical protein Cons2KO_18590 [Congregibacter sp.]